MSALDTLDTLINQAKAGAEPQPQPETLEATAASLAPDVAVASSPSPAADPDLSVEQHKRLDLLHEYEELSAPARAERNAAIDAFDADWRERWMKLQGEVEEARAKRAESLTAEGVDAHLHDSLLAKETAALVEDFEARKDAAARDLDKSMPRPARWVDFLGEKVQENPGDPVLESLLEEARKAPDPGIEGFGGVPAKAVTLSDLVHNIDKDGQIHYKRGLRTVIHDRGSRLDVQRNDDRDIEAALKISAQKFDLQKGLMLTGDLAFKVKAAEIAGKLGYPLQNSEPEVLMAWKKGRDTNPQLTRAVMPSVERGITGDLAVAKPIAERTGPVQLRADPLTVEQAGTPPKPSMPGSGAFLASSSKDSSTGSPGFSCAFSPRKSTQRAGRGMDLSRSRAAASLRASKSSTRAAVSFASKLSCRWVSTPSAVRDSARLARASSTSPCSFTQRSRQSASNASIAALRSVRAGADSSSYSWSKSRRLCCSTEKSASAAGAGEGATATSGAREAAGVSCSSVWG